MLVEFLEKSAKQLVKEFGEKWNLPFTIEKALYNELTLRDAEILTEIEIQKNSKEMDTLPPENDKEEKTKVDNSI